MKSNFTSDLKKEQRLSSLLDSYYTKHLKNYHFERIHDINEQLQGVDLLLKQKSSHMTHVVDEKAQLDYINESLPTFAFELSYFKNDTLRQGWLYDTNKKTDFYALITSIYEDEPEVFTSCKVTFVNRQKLITFLETRRITQDIICKRYPPESLPHGKTNLKELNPSTEGYLYHSKNNKSEKPINLVLRLEFLLDMGLAKNLF